MAKRHVHKFVCVSNVFYHSRIWKCAFPECVWFVHLGLAHVMLGKLSFCWQCDEPFVMTEDHLTQERPICTKCANPMDTSAVQEKINELQAQHDASTDAEERRRLRLHINLLKEEM